MVSKWPARSRCWSTINFEDQYHELGASSLALVAAPRPDASYQDINDAVAQLRQIAGEFPGVTEKPNPTQRPPQPDRPYVVSLRLDPANSGTSDVAKQLRQKVGVKGDQSGQTANGRVRLYVIGQGALSPLPRRRTPNMTSPRRKAGTCRSF